MILNAVVYILVFPVAVYFFAKRSAHRTYKFSGNQTQLAYHPLTGQGLQRAINTARLLIIVPPVMIMSFLAGSLIYAGYLTKDSVPVSIPGIIFLAVLIDFLVLLVSFLFMFLVAQFYLRRTCKELGQKNPDHKKQLEDLPNQLARNVRFFGRKLSR